MCAINNKVILTKGDTYGDYYNPQEYDFAKALSINAKEIGVEERIRLSGINTIAKIINEALAEKKFDEEQGDGTSIRFASSLYIEYNVLGSILDSNTSNQLTSFMYIQSNEENPGKDSFVQKTIEYTNSVIDYSKSIDTYTLFYHPDVFINPEKPQVLYSIIGPEGVGDGSKYQRLDQWIAQHASNPLCLIPSDSNASIRRGTVSFPDRTYESIIKDSGEIDRINDQGDNAIHRFHQRIHHLVAPDATTIYITIPVLGSSSSNRLDDLEYIQGQGVIFITIKVNDHFAEKVESSYSEKIKDLSKALFRRIGSVVRTITYNYLFNIGLQLQQRAKEEAIKSAKAAIMSRNMSHNLGSHVMAYLKNDLRSVPSIFESNVLSKLYPDSIPGLSHAALKEVEMPFLIGLGSFIGYLQERQDYIATIASSYIPSFSPVNFKDAVYDELNPDLRFERHHKNDKENHNRPQNILLSYIAKSEKLSRFNNESKETHDILLGFKSDPQSGIFGLTSMSNVSDHPSLTPMRQINFALPGGIVGRQALFSVIENIIRNAAKHNNVEGDLALIFEVLDGDAFVASSDAFIDSIESECIRKQYHSSTDISGLLILSITDNQECKDSTILKLRKALQQDYLGKNANLNKGIKEIKISSTWMRGADDDNLFAPCPLDDSAEIICNKKAPIVAIEKSREGHLRYLICLRKTYEVALVHKDNESKATVDGFVRLFNLKKGSFIVLAESDIIHSDICFEYIIAENQDVFNRIRPYVSNRCICRNAFKGQHGITAELIYQTYTGIGEKSPMIFIEDTKTPVDNITYPDKIKIVNSFEAASKLGVKYLYRSHHFGENEFVSYWNDRSKMIGQDKNVVYADKPVEINIDAITGDNSSDRLVRREVLDKKWYYGHLYALKSDVAVFDERLFQIVHGLDESQMVKGSFSASNLLRRLESQDWHQELSSPEISNLAYSIGIMDYNDVRRFVNLYSSKERDDLKDFLSRFCFRLKDGIVGKNSLTAAYREKGVEIYTIIPMAAAECLIVGCSNYEYKPVDPDNPEFTFPFKTIARIYKKDGEYYCTAIKKCHYMTIHQGLIDKMYSEFNISDDDKIEKLKLLHALYDALLDAPETAKTDSFLPQIFIHSGRGHITSKDMPMNLPFLQYSAIEHAVLDSKYSLIELLDFAKYN